MDENIIKQTWSAELDGRKFTDFGFGNASGYYDIIDRTLPHHSQTTWDSSDGVLCFAVFQSRSVSMSG